MTKEQIAALAKQKLNEARALYAKVDATEDEKIKASALVEEAERLKAQYDSMTKADAVGDWLKADSAGAPVMPEERTQTAVVKAATATEERPSGGNRIIEARYRRVKNWNDDPSGFYESRSGCEKAYRFGRFALASLFGHTKSAEWCKEHGIHIKAQSEGVNTAGGYLVPEEFSNDLIDLRERYGVFRRRTKVKRMTRDVQNVARRTGGLTGYWVSEGQTITDSDKDWDLVRLTAKKLATIALYSSEVAEDAIIDIGDDLAEEIAYCFAYNEDLAGFVGDGTSTYGNNVGVTIRFRRSVEAAGGTWTTDANRLYNPSIVNATGNLWSEFTIGDFTALVGSILDRADGPNCAWYCHRLFWASVMLRLEATAGGVTRQEIRSGGQRMFLGYPVEFTQVMPKADGASQIACLFGDLALASTLGDRRETTISLSDQYKWAEDQLAIKGTERVDVNVHDVGTANSSAASRAFGPIGALASLNA